VEPRPDGPAGQCVGPADQHQERRLEGVLGVGGALQHPAADAVHQRPEAVHQLGERVVVAVPGEPTE
jgi:hypothetical protein